MARRERGSDVSRFHAKIAAACLLAIAPAGCGITPKSFRALSSPAAIVRARAVGLGEKLPPERVVPALIERLNDSDPVVRLTAHEELRQLTGKDFGYVPWGDTSERLAAADRWKTWWNNRQAGLGKSRN